MRRTAYNDEDATRFRTEKQRKYDKAHTTGVYLKLNNETDKEILEKLRNIKKSGESQQGYIKRLIRKDIAQSGNSNLDRQETTPKAPLM